MRNSLERKMKAAVLTFTSKAETKNDEVFQLLSDNRYLLVISAKRLAAECKVSKPQSLLSKLFEKCFELYGNGKLPSEDGIAEQFEKEGIDGVSEGLLPLALSCVAIECAAKAVRTGNAKQFSDSIDSLRRMSEIDFESISKKISRTHGILACEPSGVYLESDSETQKMYRRNIAVSALKTGKNEKRIAENLLRKVQDSGEHIGKYIFNSSVNTRQGCLCIIMGILMPLATAAAAGFLFADIMIALLLFFPLTEIFRVPVEKALMKGKKSRYLPRLRAADCGVLLTVSTLLPSADSMSELKEKLEQLYLSNGSENIKVCCLADFKASDMPVRPEDKHIVNAAKNIVAELNEKYGSGFILAVRPRSYSGTQNKFIGKERKRGAITELIRAIKGTSKGFLVLFGDTKNLSAVKYLAAIDWDTEPAFGSIEKLVAVAEHPLNTPVIENGRVVSGYGLFVPKIENSLKSKFETGFTKLMAGNAGFSYYDFFSCEKYQLLFGESVFCGKGLINVNAYYETLDKALPAECILSHDTVESGYLRAAYVAEAQFVESFPKTVSSFYRRMHRWVRGDFQNIGFVFGKNPLNVLSRYKIFDNLCRNISKPFCVTAVMASAVIQGDKGVLIAAVALFSLCANMVYAAAHASRSGLSAFTRLDFSGSMPSALDLSVKAFISLAFSVKESFVCLNAAIKALWRLLVSGNNLLEWETAANSEKAEKTNELLKSCIPSVAVSAALMILGLPIHRLAAIIFLADIPLTLFSGAKIKKSKPKATKEQREYLISFASSIWDFFDEHCVRENNFLPPDSIRFSPSRLVIKRTSPTNIGLMLTSFLAARDFGFITTQELYMRLNLSLSSIEKLEKYNGNLLNWYSTETLEALSPRFVSTVDSGNFLCCLVALKEGLREYVSECGALNEIVARVDKLIDETDLSGLYNSRKKLFHIGLNLENGEKSESCYDLFMSEMRMTSYYAVAKKIVPESHWKSLGRIAISDGRYAGIVSWTGTMFEYFMPEIFLPSSYGSLSREALMFCLFCQKKYAGKRPFGKSESEFYAFGDDLNYKYKAHGIGALAIKKLTGSEAVVSPYSSFLSLQLAPDISVRNLRKLEKSGLCGKYGFYEAADYTAGKGKVEVIYSFMSHHLGMSLISVDNALNNSCIQKRFMNDRRMKGAKSLLDEKGVIESEVYNDTGETERWGIRNRAFSEKEKLTSHNGFHPKATAYSNGRLTECITDTGEEVLIFDGVDLSFRDHRTKGEHYGIYAVLETEKEAIPFFKASDNGEKTVFSADFEDRKAVFTAVNKKIVLKTSIEVLEKYNCVKRVFTVENKETKKELKAKLIINSEFFAATRTNDISHTENSRRTERGERKDSEEYIICSSDSCAIAAGFIDAGTSSQNDYGGYSVDICLACNEKASFTFIVSAGKTKETAVNDFMKAKQSQKLAAAGQMTAEPLENALTQHILTHILFPNEQKASDEEECSSRKSDLDIFGISGDIPIVTADTKNQDSKIFIAPFLKINKAMRSCGIQSDLVIIYKEEDPALISSKNRIERIIEKENVSLMVGVRGGIHLVNSDSFENSQLCKLKNYSCCVIPEQITFT